MRTMGVHKQFIGVCKIIFKNSKEDNICRIFYLGVQELPKGLQPLPWTDRIIQLITLSVIQLNSSYCI